MNPWRLFDGAADLALFLGRVVAAILLFLAYILLCLTLAGWAR